MSVDLQNSVSAADPKRRPKKRSGSEWEIVGGLREGDKYDVRPLRFDGYLLKKRNPPLKGWHKVRLLVNFFAHI